MSKTAKISRGLSHTNIDFLNSEYDKRDSFWRSLMDDKRLFMAIRNNKINMYRHGCSLVEISPKPGKKVLECVTASKYLTKSGQIKSINGQFEPDLLEMHTDLKDMESRASVLATMRRFAGPEKEGVTALLDVNPNVVDVEIALPGEKTRIDLLLAMKTDSGHELVFFEAKTPFDSRVRCNGEAEPVVIEQMKKYQSALKNNKEEILDSYRTVITNLKSLHGLSKLRMQAFEKINVDRLTLCETPHLVFVGFDAAQKNDWMLSQHLEKLKEKWEPKFIHLEKTLKPCGACA